MNEQSLFQQLKHLNGLQRLQALQDTEQRKPQGMEANLGYKVTHFEPGRVEMHYQLQPRHMNLIGTLHGGAIAALLDTVIGASITTLLKPGEIQTITDLHVRFLRPVMPGTESLTVIGTVEKEGKRLFSGQARITDQQGELMASASAGAARL